MCLSVKQSALNGVEFIIYIQLTTSFTHKNYSKPSWNFVSETFPSLFVHVFRGHMIVCFACSSTQQGENSQQEPGVTMRGSFWKGRQVSQRRRRKKEGNNESNSPFFRSFKKPPTWTQQISSYFSLL